MFSNKVLYIYSLLSVIDNYFNQEVFLPIIIYNSFRARSAVVIRGP